MAAVSSCSASSADSSHSRSKSPPVAPFRRTGSIDIYANPGLFTRARRLSSTTTRNSGFDCSLDLTLSSAHTQISGPTIASGGSEYYQNSYSLNNESTSNGSFSSVSTNNTRWGNFSVKFSAKHFVAQRLAPLEAVYQIGDVLGEGGYGEVYRCIHIESGQERAVKVIGKDELHHRSEEEAMKEFNILKECDHPNLLKCYECFEDAQNFYIVSDIIKGGELYDELDRLGSLSEEDTRVLMNVLLTCINYCHKKGLIHCDLKPENVLLEPNRDYNQLKIIDFGLAQKVQLPSPSSKVNSIFTDIQGSKYYMSPQVVRGSYSSKCDIWSAGVIAFVMLSGYAPFDGDTDEEVHRAVLDGYFDFDDEVWDHISDDAKDFVRLLLTYEEEERPTAEECLQHPWLQTMRTRALENDSERRASKRESLNDLQRFHTADSKLKQATCAIIASQLLSKQETEDIDETFRSLDVSCSGNLTGDDLKQAYRDTFHIDVSDDDINELIRQVNFSGTGVIEYSEFVIATMMEKNKIDDDKLRAAFHFFDKENKGYISPQNLTDVLHIDNSKNAYVTRKIVGQVDANGDGLIDFEEFKNMMFSRNLKRASVRRSSRARLSITSHILEELDEREDEDDISDHQEEQQENHDCPAPRSAVGGTLLENSEEDDCSDSATVEEDLFASDDDIYAMLEGTPAKNALAEMPKRRKARKCASDDRCD